MRTVALLVKSLPACDAHARDHMLDSSLLPCLCTYLSLPLLV